MRIGLKQFNAWVGDFERNTKAILAGCSEALKQGCDIVVFPELSLCGYPPEDLLLKKSFLAENLRALSFIAENCGNISALVGLAQSSNGKCYNSGALISGGKVTCVYNKRILPNYGVFDEKRYFEPGFEPKTVVINGIETVLTICEDVWQLQAIDRSERQRLIINISASPYHYRKIEERKNVLGQYAKASNCAIAYCNLIGGQDELVFDGRSMFINADGTVAAKARAFEEDLLIADVDVENAKLSVGPLTEAAPRLESMADVFAALVLGTGDYVRKNGFAKVLIGLSGGIDSNLVAAIAVEALGAENVIGITMPSRFNSPETVRDAKTAASNLGMKIHTVPIEEVLSAFNRTLSSVSGWTSESVAYENLQARIRGTILMSLSNCLSYMVLTTGNKSETAVGYSTLYGDTAGGFAVIKDVPKTMVYDLCRHYNNAKGRDVIPDSVIKRIPSAELRPNQKDSDTLPEYSLLDEVIKGYIEEDKPLTELCPSLECATVRRVVTMIDRNEYKRRQSPPGIKITPKAFGRDRRMPITNRFVP